MTKEELISILSAPMQFQMVANATMILENNNIKLPDLFEITFHSKKEIAFRAAWMLEYLMINKPEEFVKHLSLLCNLLPQQKNQSAMRHYSKIFSLLTDKRANALYQQAINNIDFEPVIEVLFAWLVEPEVLVATKVHCMQTLANLSGKFDWIRDELLQTIYYLERKESVAFFARARVVKKTLGRYKSHS
ncbi:MAG: hypothetical protein V4687_08410 [Bacteroidota bacterium]